MSLLEGHRVGTRAILAAVAPVARAATLVLALAGLGACVEITTPPERAASYLGDWAGPDVTLSLSPRTMVYRKRGGVFDSASIQCDFSGLSGADIVYRCRRGFSRLPVNAPPRLVGKKWKMTVEGRELVRR
jgi:hypothetical protein